MLQKYFYYSPADVTLCEEHMAKALGEWFPETAEECKGSHWDYEGWDLEELVSALEKSGELLPGHFYRLGVRMGSAAHNCESLH
ncbi:hypothetical protein [Streptomyces sp. 4F14]|uniref:hypothetical protein n=1 Tax=Streptomyces sp. 4F14 TaxID=3394380 RepID=UPI003A83D81B